MKDIRAISALTACVALSLAACTSPAEPETPAATNPAAQSTSASASASTSAHDASPVTARELCDYLKGQLPTLRAIDSEVGTMANLTVNLYSWYEKRGPVPTGDQLDEQTRQTCPEIRDEVLKISGMESFARL